MPPARQSSFAAIFEKGGPERKLRVLGKHLHGDLGIGQDRQGIVTGRGPFQGHHGRGIGRNLHREETSAAKAAIVFQPQGIGAADPGNEIDREDFPTGFQPGRHAPPYFPARRMEGQRWRQPTRSQRTEECGQVLAGLIGPILDPGRRNRPIHARTKKNVCSGHGLDRRRAVGKVHHSQVGVSRIMEACLRRWPAVQRNQQRRRQDGDLPPRRHRIVGPHLVAEVPRHQAGSRRASSVPASPSTWRFTAKVYSEGGLPSNQTRTVARSGTTPARLPRTSKGCSRATRNFCV